MFSFRYFFIAISIFLWTSAPATCSEVSVTVLSDKTTTTKDSLVTLGFKMKMAPGWHTYWKNPGDAGYATHVLWELPEKVANSEISWPTPEKIYVGDLVNYGFKDEVTLISSVKIPSNYQSDIIRIDALIKWLACKEICIPGEQKVSKEIRVGNTNEWNLTSAEELRIAQNMLPQPLDKAFVTAWVTEDFVNIKIDKAALLAAKEITFFPETQNIVEPGSEILIEENKSWLLRLNLSEQSFNQFSTMHGIIHVDSKFHDDSFSKTIKINDKNISSSQTQNENNPTNLTSIWAALFFSLIGGFLLNFMPCVFPVVSIKILGFIEKANSDIKAIRIQGGLFALGILISFWIIFLIMEFLLIRNIEVGWGFQLQSPIIITGLIFLFFFLALSFLDTFSFGSSIQKFIGPINSQKNYTGALLSGLLATLVATPCTAPLMGSAIGFSITQPLVTSFTIYSGIGIGMAFPYILLSYKTDWLRFLPKPGAWMQTIKQVFAFPLFLTVVWLVWVLGHQVGINGVLKTGIGIIFFGAGLFAYGKTQVNHRTSYRKSTNMVAIICVGISIFVSWPNYSKNKTLENINSVRWEKWTPQKVQSTGKRPIFVDFTAAWCLTCQFNKKTVLYSREIEKLFMSHDFKLLTADWTNHDPEISLALKKLGRRGIPVYVVYPPNSGKPIILPEILTKKILINAVEGMLR